MTVRPTEDRQSQRAAAAKQREALEAGAPVMFDLVSRVAALNPDAGEIGPGMLAQLVTRSQAIVKVLEDRAGFPIAV